MPLTMEHVTCSFKMFMFDAIQKALASNVAKISKKCTSKYVIAMFNMLSELVESKARFLKLFEQSSSLTKTTRHISNSTQLYLDIFVSIEKAVSVICV